MKPLLCVFLVLASAACIGASDEKNFAKIVENAEKKSLLTSQGRWPFHRSRAFHMRIFAWDTTDNNPEYRAEIELWWKAPNKWKRRIRSSVFDQTAIQNGKKYYETNSSDYLPWWLHELVSEALDPVPDGELRDADVDFDQRGCAHWESEFAKDSEKATVYNNACFNPDGTVEELFTCTVGVKLGNYKEFGKRQVPRAVSVWTGRHTEVRGRVSVLEDLRPSKNLFSIPIDTGLGARVRFVSVPESAIELDQERTPPSHWPVVHNFPAKGVMAVHVNVDRSGNVREVGTIVSSNFVLQDAAREQVKAWKFKPYLRDGFPVQVNTTLAVRFETKVELLGTNEKGMMAKPFADRTKNSHEMSDPRRGKTQPFHLRARFEGAGHLTGTYEEFWQSDKEWKRKAAVGDSRLSESCDNGKVDRQLEGPESRNELLEMVMNEMGGRFPDRKTSVHEADWGQSAVKFGGEDMVRVARGKVDENNQPISGQAYWFDSTGLLRGAYEQATTALYNDFRDWNGKRIPRMIEVKRDGERVLLIVKERIDAL